jgi:transcriptional regulator with XRE-family HTH domain
MSQHQFSIAVGCASGQAVSRWERGLNAPCEEFQRALDNLMEGEKR